MFSEEGGKNNSQQRTPVISLFEAKLPQDPFSHILEGLVKCEKRGSDLFLQITFQRHISQALHRNLMKSQVAWKKGGLLSPAL